MSDWFRALRPDRTLARDGCEGLPATLYKAVLEYNVQGPRHHLDLHTGLFTTPRQSSRPAAASGDMTDIASVAVPASARGSKRDRYGAFSGTEE
jgi:hypothetical protein